MIPAKQHWLLASGALLVVLGLPFVGKSLRSAGPPGCQLDGVVIEQAYVVRVTDALQHEHSFCSVRCAQLWLERHGRPVRSVKVTDELSGQFIDQTTAWYVRSSVVTTPTSGNRVHVFRERAAALEHAATHGGRLLEMEARPFEALENGSGPTPEH